MKAVVDAICKAADRRGQPPAFFLRDDDATRPGPQLDRLLALCGKYDLPVALAVIPATATDALGNRLSGESHVVVWQHGFSHANHAGEGEKKSEFPAHHPAKAAQAEIAGGMNRLRSLFGAKFDPVFVPPWNRLDESFLAVLTSLGFRGLSDFGKLTATAEASGLAALPCALDPIDWRGNRSAIGPAALLDQVAKALATDRPIGLLTHHAVQDAATWHITEEIISVFAENQAIWHQPTVIPR